LYNKFTVKDEKKSNGGGRYEDPVGMGKKSKCMDHRGRGPKCSGTYLWGGNPPSRVSGSGVKKIFK